MTQIITCTGAASCIAPLHIHGCFADTEPGHCDQPAHHEAETQDAEPARLPAERAPWVPEDVPAEYVAMWSETLGGTMAKIEYEAKLLGAHDILAKLDQVRALQRNKVEEAVILTITGEGRIS